jgi:hypothetical protein
MKEARWCHGCMIRGGHGLPKLSLCPTLLHTAGGPPLKHPYGHFCGGPPGGRAVFSHLQPLWTPHDVHLWEEARWCNRIPRRKANNSPNPRISSGRRRTSSVPSLSSLFTSQLFSSEILGRSSSLTGAQVAAMIRQTLNGYSDLNQELP